MGRRHLADAGPKGDFMKKRLIIVAAFAVVMFLAAMSPVSQGVKRVADFYFDVAAGDIQSHSSVNKFGRNVDVDTGSVEDIWDGGGQWSEPSAAQVYTVTSTSTTDDAAGTGARTMQIYGLDSAGALQNETISLDGTTPVTLTNQYSMIHRMIVRTAGSGGANAGTISAWGNTDGTITAQVGITNNQTLMAIYKIPAGNDGCVIGLYGSINRAVANSAANLYLYAKPDGETWQLKQVDGLIATGTSHIQHFYQPPNCFEPLTLLRMASDVSANNNDISAGFDLVLHPN